MQALRKLSTAQSSRVVDPAGERLTGWPLLGYWDVVWSEPQGSGIFDVIQGTHFEIIHEDENQVEVSFTRNWDPSLRGKLVPLNIDKRFIMLRGCSGFYTYAIYEHREGWPDFDLAETRVAFKLRKDKFRYMAIADNRQRFMPMPDDRMPDRSQKLAYPEAVLLTNPVNPDIKGEVDDKYQYSSEDKDIKVHGWMSFDPPIGFWQITPSDEFRGGGPIKQDLTSHVGPITLAMFLSAHYSGEDIVPKFRNGEYWKKVFGPVFIYLNSTVDGTDRGLLWDDAKLQVQTLTQVESWPYGFPVSEDFQKRDQRGSVTGRLLVRDKFIDGKDIIGNAAFVGLALPGEVGSWQREFKGYQFWTRADDKGIFTITNVRTGNYNIYAWVPGFIGDYKLDVTITITSGSQINLGDLVYKPPRDGPTLWEIGIPDRSAAEFFIPEPNPIYVNRLYVNHPDRFKQYGLWERYADLYPDSDLIYSVGESDYRKDWFFAHVTRKTKENSYQATTWQIKFRLGSVHQTGAMFRLALASATLSELQVIHKPVSFSSITRNLYFCGSNPTYHLAKVRFNDATVNAPHFTTKLIGRDNSIARHGIHGLYWLFNIDVQNAWLIRGDNTIYLTQTRSASPFHGIMYDYIRMEGPPEQAMH
ncbi:Rhamnogalacturonate lyase [Musa troglodytarum]|uniref:rhamnogalacturonan endolyase n=1 Tax=Musa troglodytarum TaxID=320322 RepID=A0A9E7GV11_9LILI|nr:Rhamnogalacturonate lyase [Musa troglodytarum]